MGNIVPNARPQASRDDVLSFITDGQPLPAFPFLVGRRGYYADSMGKPGVNERNIYDDAVWIIERTAIIAFNANCDPGRYAKHMATLKVGRWQYRPGIHNLSKPAETHYEALVQAAPVTVVRDEEGEETGLFGINLHCGGFNVTSSLGCQTIPPAQWGDKFAATPKPGDFMHCIHAALKRENRDEPGRDTLWYILTARCT